MRTTTLLLTIASLTTGLAGQTNDPPAQAEAFDAASLYAALRDVEFDPSGALEVQNIEIRRGPATFLFERGTWVPMAPVGGQVTGAFFEGEGRFLYDPPEGVEQDQLVKFTDSPSLNERFESLYLRFTDGTQATVAGAALTSGQGRVLERAKQAHEDVREHVLVYERANIDARLLAALANHRNDIFFGWIDPGDDEPLSFRRDPAAPDLYTLTRFDDRYDMVDTWGAFGPGDERYAHPLHYTIEITLDGDDIEHASAFVRFQATRPGTRALQFRASPLLEVERVLDDQGEQLFFAREEGSRPKFEELVTVAFPEDLPTDEPTTVAFVYGGDMFESIVGRGEYAMKAPVFWYPHLGYLERATFDATFRVDPGDRVFASGELISDEVIDGWRVYRYKQEMPVAIFSFNYGDWRTQVVEVDGLPPIIVFGETRGFGANGLGNAGADVVNAMQLFEQMFGEYPFSYMYATRIPYAHGQGFPGLLHLAAGTFTQSRSGETPGATEAFRGHEAAHTWWGHVIGWKTYRDQWISEGFAEYSGALYAAAYLQDEEVLDKMIEAWRNDILGKGNSGFRQFGRSIGTMRFSKGSWSGPISIGTRLSSSVSRPDYGILVYEKGAFVLHMLRMMLYDYRTRSDEAFREMMRDFVATHWGTNVTTDDFERVVERHTRGRDMSWFFDQWVHGTAIPSYRYAWTTETNTAGDLVVKVRVRQTVEPDVPFRMVVPVRMELDDGRSAVFPINVSQPEEVFIFNISEGASIEISEIVLNPDNAVLAGEVEKERW